MKTVYNSEFTIWMDGQEVECILHSVELLEDYDCRDEYVGTMVISIGEVDEYQEVSYSIWGNGEDADEYANDFGDCYICLPTSLEYDEDDELETYHYDLMMEGV